MATSFSGGPQHINYFLVDSAYLADPPADYFYPAYDMFDNLAAIKVKLNNGSYAGEYEFQDELYKTVL